MNRVQAPDIPSDLEWVIEPSGGTSLKAHRGGPVLLDFWTRSCVACVDAGLEIDRLRAQFGAVLTVVGVHCPKFPAERHIDSVRHALSQLRVRHPVVNDPDFRMWRMYGVQEWPTAVLIAPDGSLAAQAVGGGEIAGLADHLEAMQGSGVAPVLGPLADESRESAGLHYPNRCLALTGGLVLVSEQRGDLVVLDAAGGEQRRVVGFGDPVGMCHLPDGRIAVADAGHHVVYGVDLATGRRAVLAGTGSRGVDRVRPERTTALEADLGSPHDVAWWQGRLVIALAGQHQLIAVDVLPSPEVEEPGVVLLAGSSVEGMKDGVGRRARLAQPTALLPDGGRLWFVDADSSSLRVATVRGDGAVEVATVVGHGVERSGHRDGPAAEALLQHPAGLGLDAEGRVLIADAFNGAVRRYDPSSNEVATIVSGLAEPTGVASATSTADADEATVFVVERVAHSVTVKPADPRFIDDADATFELPVTVVGTEVRFEFVGDGVVEFDVRAEPATLLRATRATAAGVVVTFAVSGVVEGVLDISATRTRCDELCRVLRPRWRLPVRVGPDGQTRVPLIGR